MDSSNVSNQQHIVQKPSNKIASNIENVHITTELNHGCADESGGAINAIATSTNQSKTKTPMCLINELVRAHQVCGENDFVFSICFSSINCLT